MKNIYKILKNKLFGFNEKHSLKQRIFILITLITLIIIVLGTLVNLLNGMNFWANSLNIISFFFIFILYIKGKNTDNLNLYINILFYTSLPLLGLIWITNAGFNSNTSILILIYFLTISSLLPKNIRFKSYIIFILFYAFLVTLQYYYPIYIVNYDNDFQRFSDILVSGILYLVLGFAIFNVIISAYENEKINLEVINSKLQSSEERLRDLYEKMPVGYYKTTADGKFIEANPAFINMLGYKDFNELSNLDISTDLYLNEGDRNSLLENNHEFNNEIEFYQLKKKDGTLIWIENNPRYIKGQNGEILNHEGLCKDITQRKEFENKIKENEESLKKLNNSKDKFFSIIAHDLKNPLSSVRDLSSMLFYEFDNLEINEKKEFLEAIKNSTNQVYNLLDNLLEWSRTQRDLIKYNPENINLNLILSKVIDIFAVNLTNKNIKITNLCNDDVIVYSDVNILNTILRNLISNSIKFTSNNGEIEIGTKNVVNPSNYQDEYQKDVIEIYIKDNGIGIENNLLQNVFKIENNITNIGTNGEKGTGLGLVLVKELVTKNKGEIRIESEVNKGTTVTVTVPVRK